MGAFRLQHSGRRLARWLAGPFDRKLFVGLRDRLRLLVPSTAGFSSDSGTGCGRTGPGCGDVQTPGVDDVNMRGEYEGP